MICFMNYSTEHNERVKIKMILNDNFEKNQKYGKIIWGV